MVAVSQQTEATQRLVRRPWLFLWAPALTLFIGIPLAGLPFSPDPRGFWAPYTLIALPFYLGLVAAPGYIAALVAQPRWLHASSRHRLWIRASLGAALACAVAGIVGGTLMFLFLVPALWTGAGCVIVWRRFERAGRLLRGA